MGRLKRQEINFALLAGKAWITDPSPVSISALKHKFQPDSIEFMQSSLVVRVFQTSSL